MSTAKFDTLSNVAGTQTVPVATVAQGSAKAWVNFNGTGTVAIGASFNVSSITDNGTGDYTVNLTTAMADINYCIQATGKRAASNSAIMGAMTYNRTATTSAAYVAFSEDAGSLQDPSICAVAIFR